jgi:hypothetical protein
MNDCYVIEVGMTDDIEEGASLQPGRTKESSATGCLVAGPMLRRR